MQRKFVDDIIDYLELAMVKSKPIIKPAKKYYIDIISPVFLNAIAISKEIIINNKDLIFMLLIIMWFILVVALIFIKLHAWFKAIILIILS